MNWFMMTLALLGTLLVTSRSSGVRLYAFILWVFTNAYWAIFALDPALRVQFLIYFILAFVGIYNNRPIFKGRRIKDG